MLNEHSHPEDLQADAAAEQADPTLGLSHPQLSAIEDYTAFRDQQHPNDPTGPAIAAQLAVAAALNRLVARLAPVSRLEEIYRDPVRAVGWIRQFNHIGERLADVDAEVLKGKADGKFEAALEEVRKQHPPMEGGAS